MVEIEDKGVIPLGGMTLISPSLHLCPPPLPLSSLPNQNNQTHPKTSQTNTKNPTQALHPTPVRSAILNILPIVPFSLLLVFSNPSFISWVSFVLSRISSPMAWVRVLSEETLEEMREKWDSFWDSREESRERVWGPLNHR